jgi:hypothetical protein
MSDPVKKCTKCGNVKPNSEFSPDKRGLYGTVSQCKDCRRAYMAQKRTAKEFVERERENGREYDNKRKQARERQRYDAEYRKSDNFKNAQVKWYKRNREQRLANMAVTYAVRSGKLPPANTLMCEVPDCTNQAAHYHHYAGYDKVNRLKVKALCHKCHGETRRLS